MRAQTKMNTKQFDQELATINLLISKLVDDGISYDSGIKSKVFWHRTEQLERMLSKWEDVLDYYAIVADDHYSQ